MEETLGKRIVQNRKRLGMTQDQLAEKLGVTAQAVSKWENDQSCPDITILPRLAEIFGVTTDSLLGIAAEPVVHEAELVSNDDTPKGFHFKGGAGQWEFKWDSGRKNGIAMALWILLTGGVLFASNILGWNTDFWGILWPTGLLVFGAFGLYPKFSFFRFGCTLFGGYFLLNNLQPTIFTLEKAYLLPIFLLLFGLSLLFDALRKDKKPSFQVFHNGKRVYTGENGQTANHYITNGETFDCSLSFGEDRQLIQLPRLSGGAASVSFGELGLDLTGCEEIADHCCIDANCSFGELTIYIPKNCRVEHTSSTAFGEVSISGSPYPDASTVLQINCSVSFGEIEIRYI